MLVKHSAIKPIDFGGLQIYDYTAGQKFSASLATIQVPPGARHPRAWSKRSDKYYYAIAGEIRFKVNGETFDLMAGDLCIIRQGEHFEYENVTEEFATLLLVHTPDFDLASEVFVEGK